MENIKINTTGNYIYIYWNNIQLAYISCGNKKLQINDKNEGFLIYNILGKLTCNGKTPLCSKNCYNNCKSFNKTIATKIRNTIFTMLNVFEPCMNKVLNNFNRYNKTYFRIHEDGDLYSMEYFNKWLNISQNNLNVIFTIYTKEPKMLDRINYINSNYKNMVIRYSIMEDTNKKIIEKVKNENIPTYICIGEKPYKSCNKEEKENMNNIEKQLSGLNITCLKSCKECKKCYHLDINRIFTTMH